MSRKPDPCVMVIFGATGDLTRRKLIPAIYSLQCDGLLPENFAVCAYARKEKDDAAFRSELGGELAKHARHKPEEGWEKLARRIHYVRGGLDEDAGYGRLKQRLAELDAAYGTGGNRLFYLALSSEYFVEVVERLAKNGLVASPAAAPPWTRVVIEKPIGGDLPSASKMLAEIARNLSEEQTYRIDHYLGKETVQNILAMRFGNGIFEPLWNRKYIDHVQISVLEKEGVGTRAGYFDGTGALNDMVQNHLLQLLCLVAMEAPGTLGADDVRNEKVKVLKNLRKIPLDRIERETLRGQYGPSADGKLPGYRKEEGVAPDSRTETFVALRCYVETWRWAGVPFLLRTGKNLARRDTEISIHFRVPPLNLFDGGAAGLSCVGNVLTMEVQPGQGISLELAAKVPGAGMVLKNVEMDFEYEEVFQSASPEAYERLLLDAMLGDATLFKRADEIQAQWEYIDRIQEGWKALPPPQFPNYPAGSWGPTEAARLVPSCAPGWNVERRAHWDQA